MLASDLKRLTDIVQIAATGLLPEQISLIPTERGTLAWYGGGTQYGTSMSFVGGGVEVDARGLDHAVSVSANQFRDLVALFADDDEVLLNCAPSSLTLAAKGRRIQLRYLEEPNNGYPVLQEAKEIAIVSRKDLIDEVNFAMTTTATTFTVPILTGMRIITDATRCGIQTGNGSSMVFMSLFAANGSAKSEIIVTPKDFLAALKVLANDTITLAALGKTLVVRDESSAVQMPVLSGSWPRVTQALSKLEFTESVQISPLTVRTLAKAASAFRSVGEIVIRPNDNGFGGILLETRESEIGQYQDGVDGTISRAYILDSADLDIAARMGGEQFTIQFARNMALITSTREDGGVERKIYLNLRVA